MQITKEIFQVGGGGLTASEDAAIYLLNFDGHPALVDAGCGQGQKKLLANIRACGVDPQKIEYLLLTHGHFDHTGGAEAIRNYSGCRIVAHELEAPFLEAGDSAVTAASWYGTTARPLKIDRKLPGAQEEIWLGERKILALHTPGHSPGSVVYLTESEGLKVLFAQDVHGPLHPSLLSNKEDYRQSLHLLLDLQADILCEGHYGVFKGKKAAADFIQRFC